MRNAGLEETQAGIKIATQFLKMDFLATISLKKKKKKAKKNSRDHRSVCLSSYYFFKKKKKRQKKMKMGRD